MVDQPLYVHHPHFGVSGKSVRYPSHVTVDAPAMFQILSHAVRRTSRDQGVVGTLLGFRNEDSSEIDVKAAYMMPLTSTQYEVSIPTVFQSEMYAALRKAHPEFVIVGWYSTQAEITGLASFLQSYFSEENGIFPYPPVFLHVNPESKGLDVRAYVSSPLYYASQKSADDCNCMFVPVATTVRFDETDKPVLAARTEKAALDVYGLTSSIADAIEEVLEQIDVVAEKVREARSQEPTAASEALGRYLFKTLSSAPVLEPLIKSEDARARIFNDHMRDLVSIVSITNSIKSQVQLSAELAARQV